MIDADIRHIVELELADGEELLWAGKPQSGPWLKRYLFVLWPLIILVFIPQ